MNISPISRNIRLDNVPKAGILVEIEADEAQRASLAADHGLLEVCSFHAEISVSHWRRNGFRLEGLIRAEIVQQCSVSLEPIPARLEIPVDNFLVQEDSYLDRSPHGLGEELMLSVDSEDEPETYSGNRFDVGALVEELFVLSLDPYPRLPGAEVAEQFSPDESDPDVKSPFSRLKELGPRK